MAPSDTPRQIDLLPPEGGILRIVLGGDWRIQDGMPPAEEVLARVDPAVVRVAVLEGEGIGDWDSSLLGFSLKLTRMLEGSGIRVDLSGLPSGAQRLLSLAAAVPERKDARREQGSTPMLERIGNGTLALLGGTREAVDFIGGAAIAFFRLARGKARFRRTDLARIIQECGPGALPIVSLISVLVGLILAFVGAVQLEMFGAEIYVANLVGLGMAREMGAMMSAVIMAGRTGAAFAAELGSMRVNEEIDALTTLGISPMEFLVIPRLLSLMLMMPLLCLYANLMGIAGGALVSVTMLDISPSAYLQQTREALNLSHFAVGLIKSVVFGVLVALSGCLRGMQCGRSSSAVGVATTSAVVTAIVCIVVSDAVLTVIFNIIDL